MKDNVKKHSEVKKKIVSSTPINTMHNIPSRSGNRKKKGKTKKNAHLGAATYSKLKSSPYHGFIYRT